MRRQAPPWTAEEFEILLRNASLSDPCSLSGYQAVRQGQLGLSGRPYTATTPQVSMICCLRSCGGA